MATITTIDIYPSIGAAWTAALALWAAWVQDNAKVITVGVGTTQACRTLIMNDTSGGNLNQHILVCADIPGTNVLVPVPHILTSPGWRNMPPPLLSVYGTTTTITSWDNQMLNLRATVYGTMCGITSPTWAKTNYTGDVTGLTIRHATTTVRKQMCIATDAAILCVKDGTFPANITLPQNPTDGLVAGVQVPNLMSLDQIQYAGLVASITELGLQSYDLAVNNGQTMFSIRGNLRSGA